MVDRESSRSFVFFPLEQTVVRRKALGKVGESSNWDGIRPLIDSFMMACLSVVFFQVVRYLGARRDGTGAFSLSITYSRLYMRKHLLL